MITQLTEIKDVVVGFRAGPDKSRRVVIYSRGRDGLEHIPLELSTLDRSSVV